MKKFITCASFLPEDSLHLTKYTVSGNSRLEYGKTRFPVMPLLNAYTNEGETVKMYLIESDHTNVPRNKKTLIKEVNELEASKNINVIIETIKTKYSEDINTQLKLYSDIVSAIEDGDELYACYTYGTKPTPIIQNMALSYACRAMKNVTIGCIVYGQFDHVLKDSFIFDITPLHYMDEISNNLAKLGVADPAKKIKDILDI